MASSAGKRLRERQKMERSQAKAERRAAREAAEAAATDEEDQLPHRSEAELVADLQDLQQTFEAGTIDAEEFEERRSALTAEFNRLA